MNTVIMGRKTWDSIPSRFAPLKDRRNVIVSRQRVKTGFVAELAGTGTEWVNSLDEALDAVKGAPAGGGKAFVIGGAQMYAAAMGRSETKRILLTRVLSDFECDTVFPVGLGEQGGEGGWVRASKGELDDWVGETVPEGVQEENGTRYVFEMWERP